MQGKLRKFGVCFFLLLSRIRLFRQLIVRYFVFNPPEVSYILRSKEYQKLNSPSILAQDFSCVSFSACTNESQKSPVRKARKIAKPIHLLRESLYVDHNPQARYPPVNFSGKAEIARKPLNIEQQRYPISQYPERTFYFITTDLKTKLVDPPPGLAYTTFVLRSGCGSHLASVYVEYERTEQVILFSHGNSCDVGWMIQFYFEIAFECQISLFSYDYSGYGQSTGVPSDLNALDDIYTAYRFLVDELLYSPQQIIIYGYSVGSGPSTLLASRLRVGGLVVHSGLSSGLRIWDPDIQKTPYWDIFPNVDLIEDVVAPTFILHGGEDSMINVVHAEQLASKCQHLFSVWLVEAGGHCNIEQIWKDQYFLRLNKFLSYCLTAFVPENCQPRRNTAHLYDKFLFQFSNDQ